jgi:hypothetical protein
MRLIGKAERGNLSGSGVEHESHPFDEVGDIGRPSGRVMPPAGRRARIAAGEAGQVARSPPNRHHSRPSKRRNPADVMVSHRLGAAGCRLIATNRRHLLWSGGKCRQRLSVRDAVGLRFRDEGNRSGP